MLFTACIGITLAAPQLPEVEAAAQAVLTPLEAVSGRQLDALPAFAITTVPQLEAVLRDQLLQDALSQGEARAAAIERIMADRASWTLPSSTILLYTQRDRTVWVLTERLGSALEPSDPAAQAALGAEALRCGLAHELTHALQDQEGVLDDAETLSSRALIEGQAVLLGRAACAASPSWSGIERLGTTLLDPLHPDTSELALLYGVAPEWVAGWLGQRPLSDSWLLFDEPAPELERLLDFGLGSEAKAGLDALARSVAGPESVEGLPMRSAMDIATAFLGEESLLDWGDSSLTALADGLGFRSARWRVPEGGAVEAAILRFRGAGSAFRFSSAVCAGWLKSRGTWIYIRTDPDTQRVSRVAYTLWRFPLLAARVYGAESSCGSGGPEASGAGVDGGRNPGMTMAIASFGEQIVYLRAPFARVARLPLAREMASAARRALGEGP